MLEVFSVDVDGRLREGGNSALKGVLGRRGWVCGVAFDPVFVRDAFGGAAGDVNSAFAGGSQWAASAGAGSVSVGEMESGRVSWGGTSMSTLTANGSELHTGRVQSSIRSTTGLGSALGGADTAGGRISLAFDFMMQAEPGLSSLTGAAAGGGGTVKYGPIVVPAVEYGR